MDRLRSADPTVDLGLDDLDASSSRQEEEAEKKEKRSFGEIVKSLWVKSGLDVGTLMQMAKGGLPPTIAVAMYQSTPVSKVYLALGYLMAIVSLLGFSIMPRAKFIQTMMINVFSVCLATAVGLLSVYCVTEARRHTSSPGDAPNGYNSSASVVAAIWLFFQIYMVNAAKAAFPQFTFPTIMYAIFTNVFATFSPMLPNMAAGLVFARRIFSVFLTGFAISTGVSLFIAPTNCRKVVFKEMEDYIGLLRTAIKAHRGYFTCLEDSETLTNVIRIKTTTGKKPAVAEAEEIKKAVLALAAVHGKLSGDLLFAKREVAYGRLGPGEISHITRALRDILLPTIGLSSVIDIFDRLADRDWRKVYLQEEDGESEDILRARIVEDWTYIMSIVREPFRDVAAAMDQGLEHIGYVLLLTKPLRAEAKEADSDTEKDVEAGANVPKPGDKDFVAHLEQHQRAFAECKESILRTWCAGKGIELSDEIFRHPSRGRAITPNPTLKSKNRRQLFVLLYMHYLLNAQMKSIISLARYADEKRAEGKLSKKRLIVPGSKRVLKWIRSIAKPNDGLFDHENDELPDLRDKTNVHLGQAFQARKDPEHLPPEGWLQMTGDAIRQIPRFFRSSASSFGFRAACATISVGILAYLRNTQVFFNRHRLAWAMIMTAISMVPTTARSFNSFVLRIVGTFIAAVVSLVTYYIVDGKTPGVIIFLWLFVSLGHYVPLKKPEFLIAGLISMTTVTMIIGYELEAGKIGQAALSSNGQIYYPIYLLASYRLATVAGGLAVAFIWTVIPYPMTERSDLRRNLGVSLHLLANYYSIVHETVQARIRGDEGDLTDKASPGFKLQKIRNKVYSKQILLLDGLRLKSSFLKWEIPVGGKFPKKQYDRIINYTQSIFNYMSLISYASQTYGDVNTDSGSRWFRDFRVVMNELKPTSQAITSLLALLSASILNGQPLPPYLLAPQPYVLSRRMEEIDADILSLRHIADPCYAAFAVIQISARCISSDLDKLLRAARELVGELDFTFHTIENHADEDSRYDTSFSDDDSGGDRSKND